MGVAGLGSTPDSAKTSRTPRDSRRSSGDGNHLKKETLEQRNRLFSRSETKRLLLRMSATFAGEAEAPLTGGTVHCPPPEPGVRGGFLSFLGGVPIGYVS
jgi:hypothetical protein